MKTKELRKAIINDYLKQWVTGDWIINKDGSVDVYGTVHVKNFSGTKLPFKFGIVTGVFDCNSRSVKYLDNWPNEVGCTVWFLTSENINKDEILKVVKITAEYNR